jgi:L-ascorbate metabolism protein UlaG (beta-lactamase superfamily)
VYFINTWWVSHYSYTQSRGGVTTMGYACGRKNGSAPIRELIQMPLGQKELAFIYLGFSGIIIKVNEQVLAFDIGKDCIHQDEIEVLDTLDVHFISHTHWDHWDQTIALRMLEATGAPIVADPSVIGEMKGSVSPDLLISAAPDQAFTLKDMRISSVVGIHPRPITLFQVTVADIRIFHGADSGYVPLTKVPADIAFLPVGDPSPSCSPQSALQMAQDLQPEVAVAVHGNSRQEQKIAKLLQQEMRQTQVLIPKPCELVRVRLDNQ